MKLSPEEEELIRSRRRANAGLEWTPRQADEYTVEEKVAIFDKLHASALAHYNGNERMNDGCQSQKAGAGTTCSLPSSGEENHRAIRAD